MTIKELWTEKYRPKTISEYVFSNKKQKNQVMAWIEDKAIPHLLFSGTQGIGKTTLAKLFFREFKILKEDILEMNASDESGVDNMRDRIGGFVNQMPYGEFRYVLLDEADYLSPTSQGVLRGYMEKYAATSRFIITCNYIHKIIPALRSRTQGFHLERLDQDEFILRAINILQAESVEFDSDILNTFVLATYPDLRKCINSLQQNVVITLNPIGTPNTKKLELPNEKDISSGSDYKLQMVNLFKEGKINQARILVCSQARPEEFDDIYRFLYENLEFYGDEQNQEEAILYIRTGLVNHAICADPEINLAATMIELARLMK